jgi:hypothetical protein
VRRTCRYAYAGAELQPQHDGGMRPATAAATGGVLGSTATGSVQGLRVRWPMANGSVVSLSAHLLEGPYWRFRLVPSVGGHKILPEPHTVLLFFVASVGRRHRSAASHAGRSGGEGGANRGGAGGAAGHLREGRNFFFSMRVWAQRVQWVGTIWTGEKS